MQSSSSGILPVLGLLACAAAVGVFAAHQWPKGPPDSALGAWDFVSCELLHHRASASPPRPDYGPAPRFDASPTGLSAPQDGASTGTPAPPVVIFDEPPAGERGRAAQAEVKAADHGHERSSAPLPSRVLDAPVAPPIDAPPREVRPAAAASGTNEPSRLDRPPRVEAPKTSAFWPKDLSELLPGAKSPGSSAPARSPMTGGNEPPAGTSAPAPAGTSAPATPAPSVPTEPRVEEFIRRLEQMGAVIVRLERQRGPAGNYLFRCELPLPQNPRYHRFFQAVDSQPARAVERVTHEVEAWRNSLR